MKKMKTLKIKDTSYEVVDDAARIDISELKGDIVDDVEAEYSYGYIDANGNIVNASSGDNRLATLKHVYRGMSIIYSGYAYWGSVWGYYSDGTAIKLLEGGNTYENKKLVINDEKIVKVCAESINTTKELSLTTKGIVARISDCEESSTLSDTIEYVEKYGYIDANGNIVNASSGDNKMVICTKFKPYSSFIFSGTFGWGLVWGYYSDGTVIKLLEGGYYKDFIITITDPKITKVIAWSNSSLVPIKFQQIQTSMVVDRYRKNYCIVDVNGNGDFDNISDACIYARGNFDVKNMPFTIYVKSGRYIVEPTNEYPYSPINKGANKISIIGDGAETTIIECYNTGTTQSKVMDIGGECIIKGLTIKSLNDGTYTHENNLGHNCYCIHIDTGIDTEETKDTTKPYTTLIEDCILYSECDAPIGAGLHNKQKQKFVRCKFIANGLSGSSLYVHTSVESYAIDMSVEVDDCTCIAENGSCAIILPNVADSYGSLKYTDIPVSIRRTIGVTNGSIVTDVSKTTHLLQSDSALNNVDEWNY